MPERADVVMLGTFSAWRRGTLQVRALPIAQELTRRGLTVTIITTPWDETSQAGVRDSIDGVSVVNTHSASPTTAPVAIGEQVRLTRALCPRVVHVFKPKGFGGFAALALAPHFSVVVDSDDWEGDGGWNRLGAYPAAMRRVFDWQERTLLTRMDVVTAASTLLERRARRLRGPRAAETVVRVPNGLSDAWFRALSSEPRDVTADASILVYGRFEEIRSDWLPRFVNAVQAGGRSQLGIRVVGPVDHAVLGMGSVQLELMGYVARDVLPRAIASATLAVMPFDDSLVSRSKQSVKILELMAGGCPVIASDVGDISATLGTAGVVVRGNDPQQFAAVALELIENKGRLREMSVAGRSGAQDQYRISRVGAEVMSAYAVAAGLSL